ncbi:hypothetical protein [Variovorax sp. W6]|uniref:hypothetical protein n=1 Tax=Variovorax sp. W6 TaxID=3093895 RepID=UPI003D80745C
MTSFDWLWDWRTLIALAICDTALLAMFLVWDARRIAFLTRRCVAVHEPPTARRCRFSPEDCGAFPRESAGSGT